MRQAHFSKKPLARLGCALMSGLLMVLSACGPSPDAAKGPAANDVGTSSGGGGFGDENSMKLLDWSKTFTANSIRRANPKVFVGLPKEWTQERLARLIENVKPEPRLEVMRYNRELMFDYRVPKTGEPYLVATALFFRAHSAIPVNSAFVSSIEPFLREIRTKLLHEAAHVMGIGLTEKTDIKARGFSVYLTSEILSKNNVFCEIADVPAEYPGRITQNVEKLDPKSTYIWAINRPTGFSMQAFRSDRLVSEPFWLKKLRQGRLVSVANFAMVPFAKDPESESAFPEYSRTYVDPEVVKEKSDRMVQQYYKTFQVPVDGSGTIAFIGGIETLITTKSETDDVITRRKCTTKERIEIPQGAEGGYKARIHFEDDCQFGPNRNNGQPPPGPIKADFEVSCIESLNTLTNFDEFLGEKEFTTPFLVQWLEADSKLD